MMMILPSLSTSMRPISTPASCAALMAMRMSRLRKWQSPRGIRHALRSGRPFFGIGQNLVPRVLVWRFVGRLAGDHADLATGGVALDSRHTKPCGLHGANQALNLR